MKTMPKKPMPLRDRPSAFSHSDIIEAIRIQGKPDIEPMSRIFAMRESL